MAFYSYMLTLFPDGETDIRPGLTIDRIKNCRGYEPGNIRFATRKEQCRNTTKNRLVTIGGETKCVTEWAEINGLDPKVAQGRITSGWSEVDAVTHPKMAKGTKR
jgi:hypothetical protein